MIGRYGLNLTGLSKLALYMNGYELLSNGVAGGQLSVFHELLRTAYRLAGCEGKGCAIILKVRRVRNDLFGQYSSFLSRRTISIIL